MRHKLGKYSIILALILAFFAISYASDAKSVYRVKLSEEVFSRPNSVAAWRLYGDLKIEWRQYKFFERFPDEKEYRYSYKEELDCRRQLAEYWINFKRINPDISDPYLDDLIIVYKSVYLPEYVYKYFRSSSWEVKKDRFRLKEYKKWAKKHIGSHDPETQVELEKFELLR